MWYNFKTFRLLPILLFLAFFSCQNDQPNSTNTSGSSTSSTEGTKFELVKSSGISFANNLTEDVDQNYLNFEYIYNGGGVAVGDINNDGLSDIYFTGNEVPNKLYLNKGNFKFEDITEKAGVAADDGWYTGVSMVDVNNDGWLDIYVCKSDWKKKEKADRRNLLYVNQKDGTFKEMANEYRLAENGYSIQASFFDYDNDGDLDVYITNHPMEFSGSIPNRAKKVANPPEDMRDKLYRNNGTTFTEVGRDAGIINYAHGLGIVTSDINNDGWTDVYVTNDYDEPDFIYINQKDGTFKNEIYTMTNHLSMFAMGVDIMDINNDGLDEIITTEMLPEDYKRSKTNMASMNPERFYEMTKTGLHYQYMHNSLQLNRGNGFFSEISQLSGISKTDWSWACLLSDYDNDGFKDAFIANGYKRDVFDKDFAKKSAEIIHKNKGNLPLFDLYEIMPSTKLRNYIYRNNGNLTFTKMNEEWGLDEQTLTQGAAVADFDNDGDLDLVTNNLDDPALIYRNNSGGNNFLRLKLNGGKRNTFGLNAKVTLKYGDQQQYQEMKMVRGFQSSTEPIMHFGLGKTTKVDLVEVIWTNGKMSTLNNVNANQVLEIKMEEAAGNVAAPSPAKTIFQEQTKEMLDYVFVHKENEFDDYKTQVLLPHRLSRLGPFTSVSDVNGDGLEDFYIGGAKDQAGAIYVQTNNGKFKQQRNDVFEKDRNYEDMGAAFFDADGDGDMDLYVVSGGTELPAKHAYYQDRLYMNNGKGKFSRSVGKIPEVLASGSCVAVEDFDQDGDQDLFVGGRVIPDVYPYSTQSYLFQNDGKGTFTEVAMQNSREMVLPGMVTSAVWTDFNNDGKKDLILVGEWMPIKFFQNQGDFFVEVTDQYNLRETVGWWNKIVETDYDSDGDRDYIVGNLGLNYKFHAAPEKPFHIYCADFDGNQTRDIVLAKYDGDNQVPVRGRQCSSQQMPFIAEKFESYHDFANANLNDIIGNGLENALHYEAKMFESIILQNDGGSFSIKKLPTEAQLSAINGIVADDFDKDGKTDVVIAGNMFGSEPETTRADASIGLLLKGTGSDLKPVSPNESGIFLPYDVKDLNAISIGKNGDKAILVTSNNDRLRILRW